MASIAGKTEGRERRFRPEAGRVYRTAELGKWTANPTRMAKRLVAKGELESLAHGLYAAPKRTKFGAAPPKPGAIMDAFLGGEPYIFTGPEYWNPLDLGATALFPLRVVYNTKRTGHFEFGGQRFLLRRCEFPRRPTPEWYAVDLIQHRHMLGLDVGTLTRKLTAAVRRGDLDRKALHDTACRFGTKQTEHIVREAIEAASR